MSDETNTDFVEQNRIAVMQELRGSLASLQSLISEKLPAAIRENETVTDPVITETYMDISLSLGYAVALFNELQSLEFGVEEEQSNPIGFNALIDRESNKNK